MVILFEIANVVDDHYMKITHVFRGVEWLVSTPKHLALYKAFGWKAPYFAHLPLMMNADGTKLSKRHQDGTSNLVHVEQFREKGYYSNALLNFITLTGGGFRDRDFAEDRLYTLQELSKRFDYTLFKTHSSKIEFERLESLNHASLQLLLNNRDIELMDNDKMLGSKGFASNIIVEAKTHISKIINGKEVDINDEILLKRIKWLVNEGRVSKLSDLSECKDLQFLWFEPDLCYSYGNGVNAAIFKEIIDILKTCDKETDILPSELSNNVRSVAKRHKKSGLKVSELMAGVRLALSGLREGPPVGEMLVNLGLNTSIDRLEKAANTLD